jgi:hypothetical protein
MDIKNYSTRATRRPLVTLVQNTEPKSLLSRSCDLGRQIEDYKTSIDDLREHLFFDSDRLSFAQVRHYEAHIEKLKVKVEIAQLRYDRTLEDI